jgi:hypothetical protein
MKGSQTIKQISAALEKIEAKQELGIISKLA